ncbi:MAG: hypothetical protein EOM50_06240 [Erysipelotrichia bacterium]|nr:hypothetical protein [Erysipelotrichia bacterium]
MDQNIFNSYFKSLGAKEIIAFIESAQKQIVLAIPSLGENVTKAILASNIKNIHVIVSKNDTLGNRTSEHAKSLQLLLSAGVVLRCDDNLGMGVLMVDDVLIVFSPLQINSVATNAFKPSAQEAQTLMKLIEAHMVQTNVSEEEKPEIGKNLLTQEDVEAAKSESILIEQQASFKKIQSFNMVFVELEVRGINIKNRTITIPKELISDKDRSEELKKILESKAHIIGDKKKIEKYTSQIDTLVKELRKNYLVSIKGYGTILSTNLQEKFDTNVAQVQEKIDDLYENAKVVLKAEQAKTVKTLSNYLFKTLKKNPPMTFLKYQTLIGNTDEALKQWIEERLHVEIGKAFDDKITIKVIYKNLSERLIDDKDFIVELQNVKLITKDIVK